MCLNVAIPEIFSEFMLDYDKTADLIRIPFVSRTRQRSF